MVKGKLWKSSAGICFVPSFSCMLGVPRKTRVTPPSCCACHLP